MVLSTPAQLLFSFRFLGHNSRITLGGGGVAWRNSFFPDLLNIWHLCSPLWISMTKGGRQGFLPQAWWTSKPQIWFTKIYRVIYPNQLFLLRPTRCFCHAQFSPRWGRPALHPATTAGDSCLAWEDTWEGPATCRADRGLMPETPSWSQHWHAWSESRPDLTKCSETKASLKRRLMGADRFGSQVQLWSKSPEATHQQPWSQPHHVAAHT